MIADLIRNVAIVVFAVALVAAAWYARAHPGYIRPKMTPAIMPPPERPALPPVPLVVVLGDMYWKNADMSEDMVKAVIRVARDYGELEPVREWTAARRVVKGELAS